MNTRPITQRAVTRFAGKWAACRAAVVAAAILLLTSAPALAQEYQKIEGKTTEDVSSPQYVAFAYAFIWLAVLVYVVAVARGLTRVKDEIAALKTELQIASRHDAAGGS